MQIASIGIDLGKTTFHLVALGERNKVLFRKKSFGSHAGQPGNPYGVQYDTEILIGHPAPFTGSLNP